MNLKRLQNMPNTRIGKILNLVWLFRGYAPFSPRFVELLLTYRCNLNCEFCYQARNKRDKFPDMSLEDAARIEQNIRRSFLFKPRIHFFGGEPTVNKDFIGILRYFSGKNYKLSLTTNGINLKYLAKELAATTGLLEINLSLNTMERGAALPLLELFKKYRQREKININLACPINIGNQANLAGMVKEYEMSPANSLTFQHPTFISGPGPKVDPNVIRAQVEEIKAKKKKIPVLFLPDIKPDDIEKYYADPAFPYNKNRCVFPWFVLFIQPNGDIIPCDEVEVKMGNAKLERLNRIWNGDNYRRFRSEIIKHGISHPICGRCCHRQYY